MLTRSFFTARPLAALSEMDRLFDTMVSGGAPQWIGANAAPARLTFPAINVYEDEGHVYTEAELPGMALEDLDVSITGNELTIRGKRQIDLPQGATALRRERLVGAFERTVELPVDIESENVQASLTNGVLLVTLPKARSVQPRKIQIRTGS